MFKNYKVILFDLDGTLVQTAPEITDAANAALKEMGLPNVTLEQSEKWVGMGGKAYFDSAIKYFKGEDYDQDWFNAGFERFTHHYFMFSGTNSKPYPHVSKALQHLKDKGVGLNVLTNKSYENSIKTLKAHNLLDFFEEVIGGDTLANKKPDPVGILKCQKKAGVNLDQVLMVGDSETDIKAARNAGVTVWVLPYGYNSGRPVNDFGPDKVIPDFSVFLD